MMRILAFDYEMVALDIPFDQSSLLGRHNGPEGTIKICMDQSKQSRISTVLHEVIESINWQLNLGLEEKQVIGLEVGLFAVARDNNINLEMLVRDLEKK